MVERVSNLLPQVHVTVICLYSGWMPAFMETSCSCCGRIEALLKSCIATPWTLICWRDLKISMAKTGPRIICARLSLHKGYPFAHTRALPLHIVGHNNCG